MGCIKKSMTEVLNETIEHLESLNNTPLAIPGILRELKLKAIKEDGSKLTKLEKQVCLFFYFYFCEMNPQGETPYSLFINILEANHTNRKDVYFQHLMDGLKFPDMLLFEPSMTNYPIVIITLMGVVALTAIILASLGVVTALSMFMWIIVSPMIVIAGVALLLGMASGLYRGLTHRAGSLKKAHDDLLQAIVTFGQETPVVSLDLSGCKQYQLNKSQVDAFNNYWNPPVIEETLSVPVLLGA